MDSRPGDIQPPPVKRSRRSEAALWLLAVLAFGFIAFILEHNFSIPFDTTYRVACAALCLSFIYWLGDTYPGEKWPRVGLLVALLINVLIFFTPLVDRSTSRGELMLFALPDAVIVLTARIVSYRVTDVHQRAVRQTMILGLIVAVAFCVGLLGLIWIEPHSAQSANMAH